MKSQLSFSLGDNNEIAKLHWGFLQNHSRTTRPNTTKRGTKHPWVKEIQGFTNKEHLLKKKNEKRKTGFFFLCINTHHNQHIFCAKVGYIYIYWNCFSSEWYSHGPLPWVTSQIAKSHFAIEKLIKHFKRILEKKNIL